LLRTLTEETLEWLALMDPGDVLEALGRIDWRAEERRAGEALSQPAREIEGTPQGTSSGRGAGGAEGSASTGSGELSSSGTEHLSVLAECITEIAGDVLDVLAKTLQRPFEGVAVGPSVLPGRMHPQLRLGVTRGLR
jgi:hypothetical protein